MTDRVPPNLVMITLDCVRPDHLGCYGYGGVETPFLDRLAAGGALFEQAVTHAPNTWVAHATLFSGCLPARHGIRAATHCMSPDMVTLAEWLAGHGYATAGFPGTTLVGRTQGFHRGFQFFDEQWHRDAWQVQEVFWRRDWRGALERATDWMAGATPPFFTWLHYMDTHHLPECELPVHFRRNFSPRWQFYDGKISLADQACVGELVGFLDRRGLGDRTLVVVFSDHGEELHEDGRPTHDHGLRDDVMRVPLILGLTAGMGRPATRVRQQVRLLDLFPTVCDLIDLPSPHGLQGESLVPLLRPGGNGRTGPGMAYMENRPKGLLGVRTLEWKLILRHPSPEAWDLAHAVVEGLFHLPTDPEERKDLSSKHPRVIAELKAECLAQARGPASLSVTPAEQERLERTLRGLGYL